MKFYLGNVCPIFISLRGHAFSYSLAVSLSRCLALWFSYSLALLLSCPLAPMLACPVALFLYRFPAHSPPALPHYSKKQRDPSRTREETHQIENHRKLS